MNKPCISDYQEWVDFLNKYDIGFEKLDTDSQGRPGLSLQIEAQKSKNVDGYRDHVFTVEFDDNRRFKRATVFG